MRKFTDRLPSRLGFVALSVNKEHRLYWNNRLIFSGCPGFLSNNSADWFSSNDVRKIDIRIKTVDGFKLTTLTVSYTSDRGYFVTASSQINEENITKLEKDAYIQSMLMDLEENFGKARKSA